MTHPPDMSKSALTVAVAAWLGISITKVEAKEVALPEVGVSFSIPESWRHEIKEEPGRVGILLKPTRDSDASAVARCRIDRHDLPERFRRYTQKELNGAYAAQPLDAAGFTNRLSAIAGMPVSVAKHGQAMFGDALAYWAKSTATETRGAATANFVSKHTSRKPRAMRGMSSALVALPVVLQRQKAPTSRAKPLSKPSSPQFGL